MFRSLDWKDKGVNINGEDLNNLRFADDVILIEKSFTKLEEMLNDPIRKGEEAGLEINPKKTITIRNDRTNKKLRIGNIGK